MAVDFIIIILSFLLGQDQGNIREGSGRKVWQDKVKGKDY